MIKKLLFAIAACLISVSAMAQDRGTSTGSRDHGSRVIEKPYVISLGPKIGMNYSIPTEPKNMKSADFKGTAGFEAGVAANIHFGHRKVTSPSGTGWFGAQVELMYSLRGINTKIENIKMNCFKVPVLAEVYVLPNFSVEAGLTFSGAMSSSPKTFDYNGSVYQTDKIKAFDVAPTLGLQYKANNGLSVSARYNIGMSNIDGNFESKVSTFEVGLGWMFKIVK